MSYQGKRHYYDLERSLEKASLDIEKDMQEYVAWKYPPLRVLREAEALERAAELRRRRDIEVREAYRRRRDELREIYVQRVRARRERWEAEHQKELEQREAERLRRATELLWDMAMRHPAYDALREIAESGELNFHGGISFRLGALETLKMVSASSIFGEPQYYRDGERAQATMCEGLPQEMRLHAEACATLLDRFRGMTTAQVMEKAIDDALDEDFGATLEWAAELREAYQMRLNPQVIVVRAAAHPGRAAWTAAHPGEFGRICRRVMSRGDDVGNQVGYWLARHGDDKRGIPAILKRAWAANVSDMGRYQMAKYANKGVGLVNVVRICHAKGPLVDELMRDGAVRMPEGQDTWERLRASGMGWQEILSTIRVPHMALLRNLRGIFREVKDPETRSFALELLKRGVRGGRQLPFRYLSAWKAAEEAREPWTAEVQRALEECMGIACENLPSLPGRCAFLADVSLSMRGVTTSSYGSMTMMEIACLASVVGASRAEEGVVFPFGTRMERLRVTDPDRPLETAKIVELVGESCGWGTANPLELLVEDALSRGERWDNIFVYSDMQAGHAGTSYDGDLGWRSAPGQVELYRRCVNPRVNVYCVQLGGYANALVPEHAYRMTNLYGWSGKELLFADAIGRIWDEADEAGHGRP